MTALLYIAAALLLLIGIVHSWLGEKYILMRLLRRDDLPKLFGGTAFTRRTLRWAWHLTTVAWWGFAALLLLLANPPLQAASVGIVISIIFTLHGLIALVGSRGQHLSWIVFLAIGLCTYLASSG